MQIKKRLYEYEIQAQKDILQKHDKISYDLHIYIVGILHNYACQSIKELINDKIFEKIGCLNTESTILDSFTIGTWFFKLTLCNAI